MGVVILICASLFSAVIGTPVTDCGSAVGNFTKLTISSCTGSESVCPLKRNTNVTLEIIFTTTVVDSSVKADVHGIIQGVPIPWNIPSPDACVNSGLTCPLQPGQQYHYTKTFLILNAYPKMSLLVKWELKNQRGEDIICASIPVKIE